MKRNTMLFSFDFRNYGPLLYCPVQADLALNCADFDPNNSDGPLVLGTILTTPAGSFDVLHAGVDVPSACRSTTTQCYRTEPRRFAHRRNERGFALNGVLDSAIKASSDAITRISFDPWKSDEYFRRLIDTEPVKGWLNGKRRAELYLVDRIQVAKGLEVSHLLELHFESNFGPGAREQMEHVLIPKQEKEIIIGYGLRKYTLRRRGLGFSTDGDWDVSSEEVDFEARCGIAAFAYGMLGNWVARGLLLVIFGSAMMKLLL
ncbi:unnamed protein product [Clonostachys rosea]|uniref:HNH nuclease domain-containing protein n=1 Tax=Bionectria ochroleuca TaxID=29856 RepID=A0ABY6UII9_BIOOC|nr:unnamed protein product [Clonostachys rosea]